MAEVVAPPPAHALALVELPPAHTAALALVERHRHLLRGYRTDQLIPLDELAALRRAVETLLLPATEAERANEIWALIGGTRVPSSQIEDSVTYTRLMIARLERFPRIVIAEVVLAAIEDPTKDGRYVPSIGEMIARCGQVLLQHRAQLLAIEAMELEHRERPARLAQEQREAAERERREAERQRDEAEHAQWRRDNPELAAREDEERERAAAEFRAEEERAREEYLAAKARRRIARLMATASMAERTAEVRAAMDALAKIRHELPPPPADEPSPSLARAREIAARRWPQQQNPAPADPIEQTTPAAEETDA
jgi:hypothetical protein